MNVISYVLWGELPQYIDGAKKQKSLAEKFYPGWSVRIYSDRERPEIDADVRVCGPAIGLPTMFRRMWALADPDVERVVFRDLDSTLTQREAAAVNTWIASGKRAHSMHDHFNHRDFPMMGGMWGLAGGLPNIKELIEEWSARPNKYGRWWDTLGDQCFLEQMIWPMVKNSCLMHSSVEVPWEYEPFPPHDPLPDGWFVGEQRT